MSSCFSSVLYYEYLVLNIVANVVWLTQHLVLELISFFCKQGHYISDVYDMKKQSWLTYNDLAVSETQEAVVQRDRDRSGYIFFYMHK